MTTGRRAWGTSALVLTLLLLGAQCFAGQVDDLLSVGKKAFGDGQYSLAITSFQSILNEYPDSTRAEEAGYLLGVSLFYAGRWAEAIDALTAFRAARLALGITDLFGEGSLRKGAAEWRPPPSEI